MSGTKVGALKAREVNLTKDPNYYKRIGSLGGRHSNPRKGFGTDKRTTLEKLLRKPKLAQKAGRIGGAISKRRKQSVTG